MSIELRLSNIDPPVPEPKRTIYRDIDSLPDPVLLGITVRYFNYDSVTLYFRITGSGAGYTFGTVNLGSLAAGANAYINLDEFASRAKPAGETEEDVTLTLRAYTDAGYSNLKWTFERTVHVVFINSVDPSYTTDFLNNFDDGTVQGWSFVQDYGTPVGAIAVATDFVLSPAYSLRMVMPSGSGTPGWTGSYNKTFATPNKPKVYAIANVRVAQSDADYIQQIQFIRDSIQLIFLGNPVSSASNKVPVGKWMRMVVPLPANISAAIKILVARFKVATPTTNGYMWMDDFKIISK